ncbi:RHS repeat-associated core domain-containing protein, partial [Allorhodopirellula solitaria]|uniref:RHS repeat-associated core domain-containing protein n=1 Tax=Allorhodopirellula solitaria TaxID=2527987 RepID=UPI0016465955
AVSTYGVHYTYTSREWTPDAGLYYFRNRWYDAQLGRFSSRDPIGFGGGDFNIYRYVFNQPTSRLDPTGTESPWGPTGAAGNAGHGGPRGSNPKPDDPFWTHYYNEDGKDFDLTKNPRLFRILKMKFNPDVRGALSSLNKSVGCDESVSFSFRTKFSYNFDSFTGWTSWAFGNNSLLPLGDGSVSATANCTKSLSCEKCCDGTMAPLRSTTKCSLTYTLDDGFVNPYDIFDTGIPFLQGDDDSGAAYSIVGTWTDDYERSENLGGCD